MTALANFLSNRRLLLIAFFVSANLNLLFVAILFGNILGGNTGFLSLPFNRMEQVISAIPADKWNRIKQQARDVYVPQIMKLVDEHAELRHKFAATLMDPDMTPAQSQNALDALRGKTAELQIEFHRDMTQILLSLSPDERAAIGRLLEETVSHNQKVKENLRDLLLRYLK